MAAAQQKRTEERQGQLPLSRAGLGAGASSAGSLPRNVSSGGSGPGAGASESWRGPTAAGRRAGPGGSSGAPASEAICSNGSSAANFDLAGVEADLVRRIEEGVIDLTLDSDSEPAADGEAGGPTAAGSRSGMVNTTGATGSAGRCGSRGAAKGNGAAVKQHAGAGGGPAAAEALHQTVQNGPCRSGWGQAHLEAVVVVLDSDEEGAASGSPGSGADPAPSFRARSGLQGAAAPAGLERTQRPAAAHQQYQQQSAASAPAASQPQAAAAASSHCAAQTSRAGAAAPGGAAGLHHMQPPLQMLQPRTATAARAAAAALARLQQSQHQPAHQQQQQRTAYGAAAATQAGTARKAANTHSAAAAAADAQTAGTSHAAAGANTAVCIPTAVGPGPSIKAGEVALPAKLAAEAVHVLPVPTVQPTGSAGTDPTSQSLERARDAVIDLTDDA